MARVVAIDCDPGTDDAIALWLALASPEIEVRLITAVGGNVPLATTLRNARAIVGLSGRSVPVVGGADAPLMGRAFESAAHVHGQDGLAGVVLPDGPPATPGHAVDAIATLLRAAPPEGVVLIGIGPATNLALALRAAPDARERIAEIVLMTGAARGGNVTPQAEFNAWSDPEALAEVVACGRPVTLAMLEVTAQAISTPDWLDTLECDASRARAARAIMRAASPSERLGGGVPQHDACAVAWVVAPELFTTYRARIEVDVGGDATRGRTTVVPDASGPVQVLDTLVTARFFALLRDRLCGEPSRDP